MLVSQIKLDSVLGINFSLLATITIRSEMRNMIDNILPN